MPVRVGFCWIYNTYLGTYPNEFLWTITHKLGLGKIWRSHNTSSMARLFMSSLL